MKHVHKKAQELLQQYKTGDPWELAKYLGIIVIEIPFKNIHGMYYSIDEHKFAFVNSNLNFNQRYHTLLHEIAHAWLHTEQNYFALTGRNEVTAYLNDVDGLIATTKIEQDCCQNRQQSCTFRGDSTFYRPNK